MSGSGASLLEHFSQVADPRVERSREHKLMDIIVIAICAIICGAEDWVAVARYGQAKEEWLASFLALPNGIPSHDTFGRVFRRLDPEQMQASFVSWVQAVFQQTTGQVIAIDGKTVRRSYEGSGGRGAIHMVSAWASQNQLVLGQVKVEDHSNEITAIPQLLQLLDVQGCIVTLDAMGCQKAIAQQIVEQEADYILTVKGNQETLFSELQDLFAYADQINWQPVVGDACITVHKGHGRIETRRCWTLADPDFLFALRDRDKWPGLRTLVKVESQRRMGEKASSPETRFFISSLPHEAPALLAAIRAHWTIENRLHWVLDIAFREDDCRVRADHAPHNFAILRHIALNLLKQERSAAIGIKNKRLLAAWDHDYLLKLLAF